MILSKNETLMGVSLFYYGSTSFERGKQKKKGRIEVKGVGILEFEKLHWVS